MEPPISDARDDFFVFFSADPGAALLAPVLEGTGVVGVNILLSVSASSATACCTGSEKLMLELTYIHY